MYRLIKPIIIVGIISFLSTASAIRSPRRGFYKPFLPPVSPACSAEFSFLRGGQICACTFGYIQGPNENLTAITYPKYQIGFHCPTPQERCLQLQGTLTNRGACQCKNKQIISMHDKRECEQSTTQSSLSNTPSFDSATEGVQYHIGKLISLNDNTGNPWARNNPQLQPMFQALYQGLPHPQLQLLTQAQVHLDEIKRLVETHPSEFSGQNNSPQIRAQNLIDQLEQNILCTETQGIWKARVDAPGFYCECPNDNQLVAGKCVLGPFTLSEACQRMIDSDLEIQTKLAEYMQLQAEYTLLKLKMAHHEFWGETADFKRSRTKAFQKSGQLTLASQQRPQVERMFRTLANLDNENVDQAGKEETQYDVDHLFSGLNLMMAQNRVFRASQNQAPLLPYRGVHRIEHFTGEDRYIVRHLDRMLSGNENYSGSISLSGYMQILESPNLLSDQLKEKLNSTNILQEIFEAQSNVENLGQELLGALNQHPECQAQLGQLTSQKFHLTGNGEGCSFESYHPFLLSIGANALQAGLGEIGGILGRLNELTSLSEVNSPSEKVIPGKTSADENNDSNGDQETSENYQISLEQIEHTSKTVEIQAIVLKGESEVSDLVAEGLSIEWSADKNFNDQEGEAPFIQTNYTLTINVKRDSDDDYDLKAQLIKEDEKLDVSASISIDKKEVTEDSADDEDEDEEEEKPLSELQQEWVDSLTGNHFIGGIGFTRENAINVQRLRSLAPKAVDTRLMFTPIIVRGGVL